MKRLDSVRLARLLLRPGALLSADGLYSSSEGAPGADAVVRLRRGRARAARTLCAAEVEEAALSPVTRAIGSSAFSLHRLLPASSERVRRGLALAAVSELIPLLRRADGDPGASSGLPLPAVRLSVSDLIAASGFARCDGVLVRRGRAYGLRWQPALSPPDLQFVLAGEFLRAAEARRRLVGALELLGERFRTRVVRAVDELYPAGSLTGERRLFRGRKVEVFLASDDLLFVRRPVAPFELRMGRKTWLFPGLEIRVFVAPPIKTDALQVGSARAVMFQPTEHPFISSGGSICLGSYRASGSWFQRVLAILARAEQVLVNPSNIDGKGGYRTLSSVPQNQRPVREKSGRAATSEVTRT